MQPSKVAVQPPGPGAQKQNNIPDLALAIVHLRVDGRAHAMAQQLIALAVTDVGNALRSMTRYDSALTAEDERSIQSALIAVKAGKKGKAKVCTNPCPECDAKWGEKLTRNHHHDPQYHYIAHCVACDMIIMGRVDAARNHREDGACVVWNALVPLNLHAHWVRRAGLIDAEASHRQFFSSRTINAAKRAVAPELVGSKKKPTRAQTAAMNEWLCKWVYKFPCPKVTVNEDVDGVQDWFCMDDGHLDGVAGKWHPAAYEAAFVTDTEWDPASYAAAVAADPSRATPFVAGSTNAFMAASRVDPADLEHDPTNDEAQLNAQASPDTDGAWASAGFPTDATEYGALEVAGAGFEQEDETTFERDAGHFDSSSSEEDGFDAMGESTDAIMAPLCIDPAALQYPQTWYAQLPLQTDDASSSADYATDETDYDAFAMEFEGEGTGIEQDDETVRERDAGQLDSYSSDDGFDAQDDAEGPALCVNPALLQKRNDDFCSFPRT